MPLETKKIFRPQKSETVAKKIRPNCMMSGIAANTKPIMTTSTFLAVIINGTATPKTPPTKEFKT